MTFDVDGYLHRIGYAGPREPTADVLRQLQRAHLLAVPFENLDINPIGTPIVLSADALFHKVVVRRRGGFCYELNGLFAIALEQLGFDVTRVAGQVSRGDGKFGPEFDHLALVVRVDGATHLADVGFGDFSLEPLDLSVRGPQEPRGAAARRMASTRPTTRRGSRGSRRGTTAGRTATASDCSRGGSRISRRSAAGSRPISTRTSARSGSARSPPPTGA
jgi:arylamine N-acetyltransferase